MISFIHQDHPGFYHFLDLLWDKGFALCYNLGSNILSLNMRADMPGSVANREYRMSEDQCTNTAAANCKCAEGSLDFLSSEWGPPPTCLLNLTKAVYRPEVFALLDAGLPQAAQAVVSAPAGAPLSANISYLYYLIKMGDGYINETAAEISSFINQEKISCALGKQLAEDHLTHLTMLLDKARTHLSAGMERAGFAAPGQSPMMHHQVGDHAIWGGPACR